MISRKKFKNIGLVGKAQNPEARSSFKAIIELLEEYGCHIYTTHSSKSQKATKNLFVADTNTIAEKADLIIVIGGDGSFLEAARSFVYKDIPMVGVNRGRKGFLTDLSPQAIRLNLEPILKGSFLEEKRFLLEITRSIPEDPRVFTALNDIVLFNGAAAKMMEFEINVDGLHVYNQRSDGLIIATPTGSTAYALSGGGPILHPSVEAMVLVPMHPHTLSNRPIVLPNTASLTLTILPSRDPEPKISCDGQVYLEADVKQSFVIKKHSHQLRLLHPKDYDYYHTLRSKLGWSA